MSFFFLFFVPAGRKGQDSRPLMSGPKILKSQNTVALQSKYARGLNFQNLCQCLQCAHLVLTSLLPTTFKATGLVRCGAFFIYMFAFFSLYSPRHFETTFKATGLVRCGAFFFLVESFFFSRLFSTITPLCPASHAVCRVHSGVRVFLFYVLCLWL